MALRVRFRALAGLFAAAAAAALAASGGCSTSGSRSRPLPGGGSGGTGALGGGGSPGVGGGLIDSGPSDGTIPDDAACARFTKEAANAQAAILIVLDRSSSMVTNNKWLAAQTAIPKAIDSPAFDDVTLGLLAYPAAAQVSAPSCLALLAPTVSCGVPPFANVPLANTGTDKSTAASGVRREIADWLLMNGPDTDPADASPGHEALRVGIEILRALPFEGKRILLFVSDGGFSCTSLANGGGSCFGGQCGDEAGAPHPTRPGYCDGACWDWEYPDTVLSLLSAAFNDDTAPVSTFVVGVPGSNSVGMKAPVCQMQGPYAIAPYSMRLALSAYAYAGSPTTVPSDCDGTAFNVHGADPAKPCHYDMTKAGYFDADSFAQVIDDIRGAALGCVFALPEPPPGETIDENRVNVKITIEGTETTLQKRSDGSDPCTTDGCWDYDGDGQVELIGKACDDVMAATSARVDILAGCPTLVK